MNPHTDPDANPAPATTRAVGRTRSTLESGTAPRWPGTSDATASRESDEVEGTENPVPALSLDWSAGCLIDLDAAPSDRIGRHGPRQDDDVDRGKVPYSYLERPSAVGTLRRIARIASSPTTLQNTTPRTPTQRVS